MMTHIHEQYKSTGCTDVIDIATPEELSPIYQLIYEHTKHLLGEHDAGLSLTEKLRLPLVSTPSDEDFSNVMQAVNNSPVLKEISSLPSVCKSFEELFDSPSITRFPICRFRAQFPTVKHSTYGWHQDEATWYAVPVKSLAHKFPATLWLSLNGASENNSIEIIPDSHKFKLHHHEKIDKQGYFNAQLSKQVAKLPTVKIESNPGQGTFFHPLIFHRSIRNTINVPRYSMDIRYYVNAKTDESYAVDWRLRVKRAMTKTITS